MPSIEVNADELQALRQCLRDWAHEYKTRGKGAYYLPGGWAGDRLLDLANKMRAALAT